MATEDPDTTDPFVIITTIIFGNKIIVQLLFYEIIVQLFPNAKGNEWSTGTNKIHEP